jgi:hypothetical protein
VLTVDVIVDKEKENRKKKEGKRDRETINIIIIRHRDNNERRFQSSYSFFSQLTSIHT